MEIALIPSAITAVVAVVTLVVSCRKLRWASQDRMEKHIADEVNRVVPTLHQQLADSHCAHVFLSLERGAKTESDVAGLREGLATLRAEMREGFAGVNERIDILIRNNGKARL